MLVVEDEFAPVNNATTFKEVLLEADKAVKVCVPKWAANAYRLKALACSRSLSER